MCQKTNSANAPPNPAYATSGPQATLSTIYDPKAPQLSVAINTSPVPEPIQRELPVDKASTITTIVKQIYGRLTSGLGTVWEGPDGHDPEWEPNPPEGGKHYPSGICREATMGEEEMWARACSELMVGASYGTCSMYNATKPGTKSIFTDADFYRTFWTDNPVYPIVMACQQLCTYALLLRGYTTFDLSGHTRPPHGPSKVPPSADKSLPKGAIGVSAGPNSYLTIFKGGWDTSSQYKNIANTFTRKKGGLTPGSLFGFQPDSDGKGQPQGSHVVFALRVCPSKGRVQFLDTGAVRADKQLQRAPGVTAPYSMADLGYNGNYDDQLFGGDISVNSGQKNVPYKGFGALVGADWQALVDGVSKASEARPGGFARLAIFRRGGTSTNDVLYVSPLLQMHEADKKANYRNASFLWSLREMPCCKNLSALWILSVPQHEFGWHVLTATRDRTLPDLWKESSTHTMTSSIWFTVDPEGCARVYRRHKTESYIVSDETRKKNRSAKKNGETDNRDIWEGKGDSLKAITTMIENLEPGVAYVDPSLEELDLPPYFRRW